LLKPAKPLPLTEGEHVRIIVVRHPDPARWNLAKIAASARWGIGSFQGLAYIDAGMYFWS
jgi:hypothetical protein